MSKKRIRNDRIEKQARRLILYSGTGQLLRRNDAPLFNWILSSAADVETTQPTTRLTEAANSSSSSTTTENTEFNTNNSDDTHAHARNDNEQEHEQQERTPAVAPPAPPAESDSSEEAEKVTKRNKTVSNNNNNNVKKGDESTHSSTTTLRPYEDYNLLNFVIPHQFYSWLLSNNKGKLIVGFFALCTLFLHYFTFFQIIQILLIVITF